MAIAVRPSTSALTTQSTRPEAISSITSSRVFSEVMVAFGAKRRATVSLAEPTSTAIFTSGLLIGPGLRLQAFSQHGAERMRKHQMGEVDHQRALRRRIERKAEIDLVRLQIEDRVAVGGFGKFQLDVEQLGDVVGHVDAHARPGAGGEILVEIGKLARQHGNAQHLCDADVVQRVVGAGLRRGGSPQRRSQRRAAADRQRIAQRLTAVLGDFRLHLTGPHTPPALRFDEAYRALPTAARAPLFRPIAHRRRQRCRQLARALQRRLHRHDVAVGAEAGDHGLDRRRQLGMAM